MSSYSDRSKVKALHQAQKNRLIRIPPLLASLLILGPLAACSAPADVAAPAAEIAPAAADTLSCGANGKVEADLFGSIESRIRWSAGDMRCDSMRRPNGEGARLRFVGELAGERLAIIIALPDLLPGEAAVELPSKVTATVEGSGRFFSTPDLASCWTDIASQTRHEAAHDTYTLEGTLFCIAPLGEINGDAAVSIPELEFSTVLNWSAT